MDNNKFDILSYLNDLYLKTDDRFQLLYEFIYQNNAPTDDMQNYELNEMMCGGVVPSKWQYQHHCILVVLMVPLLLIALICY